MFRLEEHWFGVALGLRAGLRLKVGAGLVQSGLRVGLGSGWFRVGFGLEAFKELARIAQREHQKMTSADEHQTTL